MSFLRVFMMDTINRIAEVVERRNIGFLDVGAIPTASTIDTLPRLKR